MTLQLKKISYPGFFGSQGDVVYVRNGRNIYFAGITSPDLATSTINAAETVVKLIADAENMPASSLTFYDVQTHRAYPSKKSGSYEIDKLLIRCDRESMHVTSWYPVAMSDDLIARGYSGITDKSQLDGVPEEILTLFAQFIG